MDLSGDPLKWFGLLPPPSLRQAQAHFRKGEVPTPYPFSLFLFAPFLFVFFLSQSVAGHVMLLAHLHVAHAATTLVIEVANAAARVSSLDGRCKQLLPSGQ